MTLCDIEHYAFAPKRCNMCGRRFWLEPYRIYLKEMRPSGASIKQIECLGCWHKAQNLIRKYVAMRKRPVSQAIQEKDLPEFVGQVIDIFEDFLDDRGIQVDNPERKETGDPTAAIYGSDYGELCDKIENLLKWWDLIGD